MAMWTSLALAVIGSAIGAVGSYNQAKAQQSAANAQANQAQYNAQIAEQNAQLAEEEGKEAKRIGYDNAQKKRLEVAGILGAQRAESGTSGAQVDAGSFMDLSLDTTEKGELDALALFEEGQRLDYSKRVDAWNYRNQSTGQQMQADLYRNQARNSHAGFSAGSTLIGGLAQAGSNYFMMNKSSGFSGDSYYDPALQQNVKGKKPIGFH